MAKSFSELGPLASRLACLLTRPDMESNALWDCGFQHVATTQGGFDERMLMMTDAVLVPTLPCDASRAQEVCSPLSEDPNIPAVIVVLIMLNGLTDEARRPRLLCKAREELYKGGSATVISLMEGEMLSQHSVLETIHRCEFMGRKVSSMVNDEVELVRQKAMQKLLAAYKHFLMSFYGGIRVRGGARGKCVGNTLDNIPPMDENLREESGGSRGSPKGVGLYALEETINKGSYGMVYRAEHPEAGKCAVLVVDKASMKTANMMVSLDREFCLTQNLPPHPLIVKALSALHGKERFYLILEYSGSRTLHEYSIDFLRDTRDHCLPKEVVIPFIEQQAKAVGFLHDCNVCHRDLKPSSWMVSDGNENLVLKLTDFGHAVKLCSKEHKLRHPCGSLPFCAPEVLSASDGYCDGYNGLAADVWSLGVNFMELNGGPFSVERLLEWVPQRPDRKDQVVDDLESLDGRRELWRHECGTERVGMNMVVLRWQSRWTMRQVLGSSGMGLETFSPRPFVRSSASSSAASPRCSEAPGSAGSSWTCPSPPAPSGPLGCELALEPPLSPAMGAARTALVQAPQQQQGSPSAPLGSPPALAQHTGTGLVDFEANAAGSSEAE